MGIFRQFPYSNFHDMNMDEIIKIVKHMLEEWAQYHAEWDAWMAEINDDWSNYQEVMNEAWQDMQDFINNYFDNLDVQNEINNKITAMVNGGEFLAIVQPYIPPAVTTWLADHITQPEGVVIDDSLTVEGACADAKATGLAVKNVSDKIIPSANLLDTDKNEANKYINKNTGEEETYNGWQASDFLLIEPNTTYYLLNWNGSEWVTPDSIYYAFYDGSQTYTHGSITGTSDGYTLISQSGDVYLRVSGNNNAMLNNLPMVGTSADVYAIIGSTEQNDFIPYGNELDHDVLEFFVNKNSDDITEIKEHILLTKNLFDADAITEDYYINASTGALSPFDGWQASDFIRIEPNTVYKHLYWQSNIVWNVPASTYYAFYDENQTYTHGGYTSDNTGMTSLSYDRYLRISFANSRSYYAMLCTSAYADDFIGTNDFTAYQPFGYELNDDVLTPKVESVYNAKLILPDVIDVAVGRQITLYKENVLSCNNIDNYVMSWYVDFTNTGFDGNIRVKPTVSNIGEHDIGVWVYNANNKEILTFKWFKINVVADTARTGKKALFIGDSLTASGFYPYEIQRYLSNNGVTSIGTEHTTGYLASDPDVTTPVTVYHEGRGGWSAKDYVTRASKSDVTNAFYNPNSNEFDFQYYMISNNYSDIDIIFINLGTNGTDDPEGEIDAINTMIDSIHSYNSNIPIVVSAVPNGNITQTRYINMYLEKIRSLQLETFNDPDSNVYVSPVYLNVSPVYDFRTETVAESDRNPIEVTRQIDIVHPSRYGYFKMADVYWSSIQAIL